MERVYVQVERVVESGQSEWIFPDNLSRGLAGIAAAAAAAVTAISWYSVPHSDGGGDESQ